jgi:signal-transduction protein with cAMP-binding, CBS, and nucleotidyltransferase domain
MKNTFPLINHSPLFSGIAVKEIDVMMDCVGAAVRNFTKGETIFFATDSMTEIGLVVRGRVHLIKDDFWGNCTIMTEVNPPDLFAE